jgi:hypothetical protein
LYTVTTSRFTKAKANHGIAKPLLNLKRKFILGVISKANFSIGSVEFIALQTSIHHYFLCF